MIEKGKASNAVVVDVVLQKYGDHVPLYRQSAILEREAGLVLSRMTLCGWVMQAGTWLEAIGGAMRVDLLAGQYIQADETPVGVQSERSVGKNHTGYLWQYSRPGGPVIFDFQMGRSREGPAKFLGQFAGILQSDGYAAYDKIGGAGIVHAGCMAHMRRGFVDAIKLSPGNACAGAIVARIAQLYAVEQRAREAAMSAEQRQRLRQTESAPMLQILKKQIVDLRRDVLPQSAFGKACHYAMAQWSRIEVYVNHGAVEIDNNWCEKRDASGGAGPQELAPYRQRRGGAADRGDQFGDRDMPSSQNQRARVSARRSAKDPDVAGKARRGTHAHGMDRSALLPLSVRRYAPFLIRQPSIAGV